MAIVLLRQAWVLVGSVLGIGMAPRFELKCMSVKVSINVV